MSATTLYGNEKSKLAREMIFFTFFLTTGIHPFKHDLVPTKILRFTYGFFVIGLFRDLKYFDSFRRVSLFST